MTQADALAADPVVGTILELMAEGLTDAAVASRLHVSVRTVRRRVAEYMAEVDVTSRFAAGVAAAQRGHLG